MYKVELLITYLWVNGMVFRDKYFFKGVKIKSILSVCALDDFIIV
jgi:hypothetical protein